MREQRTTLNVAAEALVQVDEKVATKYANAAERARDESETFEAYSESMEPWDDVESAIRVARAALFGAETSLDVDAGVEGRSWSCLARDAAVAFLHLQTQLEDVGIHVDKLGLALDALQAMSHHAFSCEDGNE